MRNLNRLNSSEIAQLIKHGLEVLIQGFENIGFRKKTRERLDFLEDQVALLSKKILEYESHNL